MADIIFKVKEVRETLLNLVTTRSSGPHGIPPLVLYKCGPEFAPIHNSNGVELARTSPWGTRTFIE